MLTSPDEGAPSALVLGMDAQPALGDDPRTAMLRECTLRLDVPQTPTSAEPFSAWHLLVKQLPDNLDAAAVAERGQPITLQAYDAISNELDELHRKF